ncbi:MAG: glycine cleavage system protein GcvH [Proteobacteria bacterium]|nr:glycine cleavage system protein GcvH [Pseudomonadota bacterium]
MELDGYSFPDDLLYDNNHYWARLEGDLVVMGTTDFTVKLAGEITYVDVDQEGEETEQGKPFASIESGKWVGRVYAMVSGEVVECHEELEDEPELVNQDPYGQGWLFKIKPSDLDAELDNLMKAGPDYEAFMKIEIGRVQDMMK